jgi:hypothetical protein
MRRGGTFPKKKYGKGSLLLVRSACALQKRTRDVLPLTAEGRTATHQLPSCCRGRSRPSRRHQSRTSLTRLTQQSQSTGRRRRRGAAECAQKAPPCAPCARPRGRSRRERQGQSRRFYRVRRVGSSGFCRCSIPKPVNGSFSQKIKESSANKDSGVWCKPLLRSPSAQVRSLLQRSASLRTARTAGAWRPDCTRPRCIAQTGVTRLLGG